jgi:hypothetical protein
MERPSEKMWPNRTEDEQDMEMEPVVVAPPGYGSPDPATAEGLLVPVEESPVDLPDDYGADVTATPTAESQAAEEDENRPATSATRAEWDEYARSKDVDPDEYSSKEDLIAALS